MKCVRVELHNTLRERVNHTKWQSCGQACRPPPCTQMPPWLKCDNAVAVFRLPHALLRSRWIQADWFVSKAKLVKLASGHADRSTIASRVDTAGKSFKLRLAPRLPPLTKAPVVHEWAPENTSSDLAGSSDGRRLTSSLTREKSRSQIQAPDGPRPRQGDQCKANAGKPLRTAPGRERDQALQGDTHENFFNSPVVEAEAPTSVAVCHSG